MGLSYDQLAALAGNRQRTDRPCPICGPDRRTSANQQRAVMRVWRLDGGFCTYHCARCGASGYTRDPFAAPVLLGERDEKQAKPPPRNRKLKSPRAVAARRFAYDLMRRAAPRAFYDEAIHFASEGR